MIRIRNVPNYTNPTPRVSSSSSSSPRMNGSHSSFQDDHEKASNDDDTKSSRRRRRKQQQEEMDYDFEKLQEGVIGEDYLIRATGQADLSKISLLCLKIDTTHQSLLDMHMYLSSLNELVLDGSYILSIRDLGTGLSALKALSLNECSLSDVDGISVFANLNRLSLKSNNLTDITPLAMHECLSELHLDGNNLTDFSFADTLSSCPLFSTLRLKRNPICSAPHYRQVIIALLASLLVLDDQPITSTDRSQLSAKQTNSMILEAAHAMQQLEEEREEELRFEMAMFNDNDNNHDNDNNDHNNDNKNSHHKHSSSLHMPNTSTSPNVSPRVDHQHRRGVSSSSTSSMKGGGVGDSSDMYASDLTHGSDVVLAGGMAAAIRKRRGNMASSYDDDNNEDKDNISSVRPRSTTSQRSSLHHDCHDEIDFSLKEGDVTPAMVKQMYTSTSVNSDETHNNSNDENNDNEFMESPRQHNSSRPQSAVTNSRNCNIGSSLSSSHAQQLQSSSSLSHKLVVTSATSLANASFKVNIAASNSSPCHSSDDGSDDSENNRYTYTHRGRNIQHQRKHKDTISDEIHSSTNKNEDLTLETFSPTSSPLSKFNNKEKTSIVHRDISQRSYDGNMNDKDDGTYRSSNTYIDDNDIAINREQRIAMMESRRGVNIRQRHHHDTNATPMTVSSPSKLHGSDTSSSSSDNSGSKGKSRLNQIKAGKTLGFDLTSSLAAIDQWVNDSDSGDDDDDDDDHDDKKNVIYTSNSRYHHHDNDQNVKGSGEEILSREKIMSMCHSSSHSGSGSTYDDDDDDEDDDDDIENDDDDDDDDNHDGISHHRHHSYNKDLQDIRNKMNIIKAKARTEDKNNDKQRHQSKCGHPKALSISTSMNHDKNDDNKNDNRTRSSKVSRLFAETRAWNNSNDDDDNDDDYGRSTSARMRMCEGNDNNDNNYDDDIDDDVLAMDKKLEREMALMNELDLDNHEDR